MKEKETKIIQNLKRLEAGNIFQEAYNHARWNRKYSPYTSTESFEHRLKEIETELEELKEAHESKDTLHIQEEMGDVLFDLMHLFIIVEDEGFDIKEIIERRLAKQVFRAPNVYAGEKDTKENHLRIWKEKKELAKKDQNIKLIFYKAKEEYALEELNKRYKDKLTYKQVN